MPKGDDREAIWSVAKSTRRLYYAVFTVQYLLCIVFATLNVVSSDGDGFFDTWTTIWVQAGGLVIACAANAIIFIEVGRLPMVLADMLRERLERKKSERRAEGRAEGRAEVRESVEKDLALARQQGNEEEVKFYEAMLKKLAEIETR